MPTSHQFWVKLDRYPPVLVRLLAKRNGVAMTDGEIVQASDSLSLADVKYLSFLTSWDLVQVGKVKAFTTACGIDFHNRESMRRLNKYLSRGPKFTHLRTSPHWPEFKQMLKTLASLP